MRPLVFLALITVISTHTGATQQSQGLSPEQQARIDEIVNHPFVDIVGQQARNFALQTLDGKTIQLDQFRGKPLLLSFFKTTDCPPCVDQLDVLTKISKQYGKSRLSVLALVHQRADSGSSREDIEKLLKAEGVPYPAAYATEDMVEAYGKSKIVPYNVYITRSGKILYQERTHDLATMDREIEQLLMAK